MNGLNLITILLIALGCLAGVCLGWLLRGERQSRAEAVRHARQQDQLNAQQTEIDKLHRQRESLQAKVDDASHGHHQQKRQLASMREALDEQAARFRKSQKRFQEMLSQLAESKSSERRLKRQLKLLIRRTADARANGADPSAAPVARAVDPEDLQQIRGIGPALARKLNALGIHRLQQLADLTEADADELDAQMKFPGRIRRDQSIEQAQSLVARLGSR